MSIESEVSIINNIAYAVHECGMNCRECNFWQRAKCIVFGKELKKDDEYGDIIRCRECVEAFGGL